MSSSDDNPQLMELVSMGFELDQCQAALQATGHNLEQAVNLLLSGGLTQESSTSLSSMTTTTTAAPPRPPLQIIHGPISQYSVEQGQSACTCIALQAAQDIFAAMATNSRPMEDVITPDLLQNMIPRGVAWYHTLARRQGGVEHTSVEEILATSGSHKLTAARPVQQGMLSHQPDHPLGFAALLQPDENVWTCAVVTKPPETVLVVLPPATSSESNSANANAKSNSFWLVDSHPRSQLQTTQAYAARHVALHDLVQTLQTIFPCTDLGPDIPELMAAMYNQFDVYTFVAAASTAKSTTSSSSTT